MSNSSKEVATATAIVTIKAIKLLIPAANDALLQHDKHTEKNQKRQEAEACRIIECSPKKLVAYRCPCAEQDRVEDADKSVPDNEAKN